MPKHVGECQSVYENKSQNFEFPVFYVLKGKLQQNLSEIDDIRTWSEVYKLKVIYKISAPCVKAFRKMRKTVFPVF